VAVDEQILAAHADKPNEGGWLNEMLATGLRPTLFLAQLPNLFAGNISIVHGVSGSSRTFMGEESAGLDAVRIAWERIAAGQGELFLVGAAFNAERPDMLLMFEPFGLLRESRVPDLWHRPADGMALGSAGAFLVMESRPHAEARGARGLARIGAVEASYSDRKPGSAAGMAAGHVAQRVRRAVLPTVAAQGAERRGCGLRGPGEPGRRIPHVPEHHSPAGCRDPRELGHLPG